jgi:hypothetical protein
MVSQERRWKGSQAGGGEDHPTKTTAGIRAGNFSNAVQFLTEVLRLEVVYSDKEKEFARFKLPSGQTLEVFGTKNIWHPFSTPPDWELIVADIRNMKEKKDEQHS